MIRTLRPDEPIPDGAPARYRNGTGYVRVRWHVGTEEYVEDYEHRIVAGRPGPDAHVHHVNGVKHDNRPENLRLLTPEDHAAEHGRFLVRKYGPYRSRRDADRAQRRRQREERVAEFCRLYYDERLSTPEIGQIFNVDPSNVSRALAKAGRSPGTSRRDTGPSGRARGSVQRRATGALDIPACERCGNAPSAQIHHRRPRAVGGSRRTSTNAPSNLIALCAHCHRQIELDRDEAIRNGWLVRQNECPAVVPVLYRGRWVLLDDDGNATEVEGPHDEHW